MKTLLIADIGGAPKGYPHVAFPKNFYHVGDEAILEATYAWYRKNKPSIQLSYLSWGRSYSKYTAQKISHFVWPTKRFVNRLYFFIFLIKVALHEIFNLKALNKNERRLVEIIRSNDRIHFAGGGNLNSLYPAWLYYMNCLIGLSFILRKEVILTSHTIGPFKFIDWFVTGFFLRLADIVAVREPHARSLRKPMLDVCYFGFKHPKRKIKQRKEVVIGLSLHELKKFNKNETVSFAVRLIYTLSIKNDCSFVFIPHVSTDIAIYKLIHKQVGNRISLAAVDNQVASMLSEIQKIDLLISSRYHGLVFALSQNIPSVSIVADSYYDLKNTNLLETVYDEKAHKYSLDLRHGTEYEKIIPKLNTLIDNVAIEKNRLLRINRSLKINKGLFTLNNLSTFQKSFSPNRLFIFRPFIRFYKA